MTVDLRGRTVAVVGASSGIGRGVALRTIAAGAEVVVAARRAELLDELVAEAGGGTPVVCDLGDEDAGQTVADAVARSSGRLDALFVSAGAAPLRRIETTSAEEWRSTLETNLVGINRVLGAALHLLAPESVAVVVSSEAAVTPRSHLGAHGASKAALEHSIEQWREEHPWLRLTTVSLGATVPTEFGRQFEPDITMEALNAWAAGDRNQLAFMDTAEVCDLLAVLLSTLLSVPTVGVRRLDLRSPSPASANLEAFKQTAAAARGDER